MDTGKALLIGGGVLVGGLVIISLINSMNQQAIAAQSHGSHTVNTGTSNEGNIIFSALAGLGIGIGGIIAGINSRPAANAKTPSQNQQQQTPASQGAAGFDPNRPIGPGNTPVSGFGLPRIS